MGSYLSFQLAFLTIIIYCCLLSAISVVSLPNAVHRIIAFAILSLSICFIYTTLNYYFTAMAYIIVYVGAIVVLFCFVIMLIRLNLDLPVLIHSNNYPAIILILFIFISSIFYLGYWDIICSSYLNLHITKETAILLENMRALRSITALSQIFKVFNTDWLILGNSFTDISYIGYVMYLAYILPLVILSLILLVVLISVIVITSRVHS